MNFLCGCNVEHKQRVYRVQRIENGMLVCPEHGKPLKNYMSPTVQHESGHQVPDWKAMSPPGSFTPVLEPESVARQVVLRDLDRQGQEILAGLRAKGNGK
jgi:hypothetical protein